MLPPSQMTIVKELGLVSATGTATAPADSAECGPRLEDALQAARQELCLKAAEMGANCVFQTTYACFAHPPL
jgi:hypothetical protein